MREVRTLAYKVLKFFDDLTSAVVAVLLMLLAVYAGYALWDNQQVYAAAEEVRASLLELKPSLEGPSFAELRAINPDVCAWVTLDDTGVDYPVVQGRDNLTYVNTDVYGKFSLAGTIFLDSRCASDFSDAYGLLYGHHMADGTMFASISGYKQQWYYDAHPYFYLYTNGGTYRVDLFAGLIVPGEHEVFNTSFNDADLTRFINQSTFNAGRGIPTGRIVGMCTCSYEADNYRFVVLGEMTPLTEGNDQ